MAKRVKWEIMQAENGYVGILFFDKMTSYTFAACATRSEAEECLRRGAKSVGMELEDNNAGNNQKAGRKVPGGRGGKRKNSKNENGKTKRRRGSQK